MLRASSATALAFLLAACGSGGGATPPAASGTLRLSATTLTFAAMAGDADPASQQVVVSSTGTGALPRPAATVTHLTGAGWLSASITGASAPYQVSVQPSLAGLAPGAYAATVTVAAAGALDSPQEIAVALTVAPAVPAPSLDVTPRSLTLTVRTNLGREPSPSALTVDAFGSGTLARPTASVTYDGGGAWIGSVSVTGDAPPYAVSVQPVTSTLPVGSYKATIWLQAPGSPNAPFPVPVSLSVVEPTLRADPSAVLFAATSGGGAPAAKAVSLFDWTYAYAILNPAVSFDFGAGPAGWLNGTISGTTLTLQASPGALAPGTYQATALLRADLQVNSPLALPVTLVVGAPDTAGLLLSPTSLELRTAEGTSPPAATVTLSQSGAGSLARPVAQVAYARNRPGWLSVAVSGAAPPYTLTCQVSSDSLLPGVYKANVTLASPGAASGPVVLPVLLLVTRRVTVSRRCSAWLEDGTVDTAPCDDISYMSASVYGADGTSTVPLVDAGDGTWSADIPTRNSYMLYVSWLGAGSENIYVPGGVVDLGLDAGGRADLVLPSSTTLATLRLGGLAPWDGATDHLRLSSWSLGGAHVETPAAAAGATSLTFGLDFHAKGFPLLTAADDLSVAQVRTLPTPEGGATYQRAVAAARLDGFSMWSGVPLTIDRALAPPTALTTPALDWRHSQFEAGLPPLVGSLPPVHNYSLIAVPAPITSPSPFRRGAVFPLVDLTVPAATPVPDTRYGPLEYGGFLPSRYQVYRFAGLVGPVARAAPGATPLDFLDHVARYDDPAAVPGPVVPLVTGVRKILVAGQDALAPLTGVGTSPYLTWTRPALGTVTTYRVAVYRLSNVGGTTQATLYYQDNDARPGSIGLIPGSSFVVGIQAISRPGVPSPSPSPWREGVPFGSSLVYTATLTP